MRETQMPNSFYSVDDLATRLANSVEVGARPVVFLLGSGVCLPTASRSGVPGTLGIVELIKSQLGNDWKPTDSYQDAFDLLILRRGADAANGVVRRAVLQAMKEHQLYTSDAVPNEEALDALESNASAWSIPPALSAVAALCAHFPKAFGRTVLTTNFDPLVEIALHQHEAAYFSSALHADGSLLYIGGNGTHVVHLHGFWRGSDTLHTPSQLLQSRPQLADSLRSILDNTTLVVLGYGGWDDVFMQTLSSVFAGNSVSTDILWCLYESDETLIRQRYGHVLTKLETVAARRRVLLFKGVSADSLIPAVFDAAAKKRPAQDLATFLRRVELTRAGRVQYPGLDWPWGSPTASLGDYAKLLHKVDPKIAVRAALFATEYVLPYLEKQIPHGAPKTSPEHPSVRPLLKAAHALLDAPDVDTADELFLDPLSDIRDAIDNPLTPQGDKSGLLTARYAAWAALKHTKRYHALLLAADISTPADTWIAKAVHAAAGCMHDDQAAVWSYICRRIVGGPDHLGRFVAAP